MYKKIVSMFLALSLVLGMTSAVFAADTGTITIKNFTEDTTKLAIFQILDYKQGGDEGNFSNISFTDDGDYQTAFLTAINATIANDDDKLPGTASASQIMLYITNNLNTDTFAAALAEELGKVIDLDDPDMDETDGVYADKLLKYANVPMGYYLIVDVTDTTPWKPETNTNYYKSTLMLQAMNPDVVVTLKSTHHKDIEKEIDDENTNGSYNIGDIVPFKVTATVPNEGYDEFTYSIIDTMTKGLNLVVTTENPLTVKVSGSEVNEVTGYTRVLPGENDTFSLKLTFNQNQVQPNEEIIVTYYAIVTEEAVNENENEAIDVGRDGKTTLTGDKTTVKTYGIDITKVNEYEETLEGVEFKVYKNMVDEEPDYLSFVEIAKGNYIYTTSPTAEAKIVEALYTDENGKLVIFGFEAGTYYLEETQELDGYNPLTDPITIILPDTAEGSDNRMNTAGYWVDTIYNSTGIVLPGTGGIGTTAFKATGSAMMICAAAFMFFRKRRVAA